MNEEDATEEFLVAHWRLGHYGDEALFFGVLLVSFLRNESAESSKSPIVSTLTRMNISLTVHNVE